VKNTFSTTQIKTLDQPLTTSPSFSSQIYLFIYFIHIYFTRKKLIEIKNLLYKSVLAKTSAVAH